MDSSVDTAKRVLVTLLKALAGIYCVVLGLTRESTDVPVTAAYKKVSRKAHPDQGGGVEHQQTLNAARDTWEEALRISKGRGGNRTQRHSSLPRAPSINSVPIWTRDDKGRMVEAAATSGFN